MSEPTEREDLEGLLMSPGWLRFQQFVKRQWGAEGYGVRLKAAIIHAREKQEDLSQAVARVDAANDEVNAMLSWPKQRIAELLAQEATRKAQKQPQLSRRGNL